MSIWEAVLLGLVQGIAEFLPISSSGHLSIVNNLFKISEEGHMFFDVLLHLGTLASIFIVYWQDLKEMFYEVISFANLGPLAGQPRERYPQARTFIMIVMATLPLFLILPINDMIETLYYNNVFIGVAIILTGCMLYVSDRMKPGKKTERSMTILDAVIIGLCQCVATIPGLSRSGTTITAGIATGLRRDFAVKFSFLLSIPAVLGANILSLADAFREGINWASVPAYLVGMVAAMLSGIAAINLLKYISNKGKFGGFAYYCWVMGVLSIILYMIF
ncbi:MAG: undecaprenyl-diphosphate phosphatase [Oscillospiraceae bacterium]